MRLLVLALLVASVTYCVSIKVGNSVYDNEWQTYKINHEKKYETLDEEMKRRLIWEDNMAYINKHNLEAARGQHSYTLGQGPFSDLTNEEYRARISADIEIIPEMPKIKSQVYETQAPPSMDWRTKGVVTKVKDQGECGCCWSFSTTACVESRQAIQSGRSPQDLSPQQLVDCDNIYDHGCRGGFPINAFMYMRTYGVETWDSYPYELEQKECRYNASNVVAHVDMIGFAQSDEIQMMQEVGNNGPIVVILNSAYSTFQSYSGGVYDDENCPKESLNHAVVVVGYGNSDGKDFWLIKNSFGDKWGEDGYIRLARNKNICGVATIATWSCAY